MLSTIIAAAAPAAPVPGPNPMIQFGVLAVIAVVFYLLLFRPQQKRMKEQRRMIAELAKGDEVIAAGILGRVTDVGEHFLTLEVADNMRIRVQKGAVTNVLPKGTLKSS